MIRLEGVTKRFGDHTAVESLDIRVRSGEIVGLLGPNGAGKTTALRVVAGILRPDSGRALIGGHDVAREPDEAKQMLGFIPDRPFVYEKLTGAELLRFVGELYGEGGVELEERIEELLRLWDLLPWRDRLVEAYSHGMRQKLIISSALVHRPRVLAIDEPILGMDPRAARTLKDLLRSFAADGGTALISTHTLEFAEALSDRLAVVAEGRLVAEGTIAELRREAANQEGDLEAIFLKLTGGASERRLARILR